MTDAAGRVAGRYAIAIAATAALMIWQAGDAIREGLAPGGAALFWLVSVTAGWLQMIVIARGVRASLGPERWPGWVLLLVAASLGAVPLSFEIRWLAGTLLAPEQGLPPPWVTYLNVTVINIAFSLLQYLAIEKWPLGIKDDEPATLPGSGGAGASADRPTVLHLRRRPDGVHGAIRYMQMQDHYLHVFTDQGDGLVLARMSDAVADLAGTDGLQVHKSWWVSRGAIDQIYLSGRKRVVRLDDGTEIPVGRSFEPALREAGWF